MIEIYTREEGHHLIEMINDAISHGRIKSWIVDSEGDYTRSDDSWKERAWMRYLQDEDDPNHLWFVIVQPKDQSISKAVYGVYHGRFAEMLLTHFDTFISDLGISPLLTDHDIYSRELEATTTV